MMLTIILGDSPFYSQLLGNFLHIVLPFAISLEMTALILLFEGCN